MEIKLICIEVIIEIREQIIFLELITAMIYTKMQYGGKQANIKVMHKLVYFPSQKKSKL